MFFDDFKVAHTKSPIVQQDDYYPFGLTFNSYHRENSVPNRWKFQGQEHVDDLGLNWDSFKWRNHQPDIGRFFGIDPMTERFPQWSPYVFSGNFIVNAREIEGLEPKFLIDNGKVTYAAAALLNAAFGFSILSLDNTNWIRDSDPRAGWLAKRTIKNGYAAITLGNSVTYDHTLSDASDSYWFGLLAHEQSHRNDLSINGNVSFYGMYLLEGLDKGYEDIDTEKIAYANEEYAGKLWIYNSGEVQKIFKSGATESKMMSMLESVGSRFRRDVVLNDKIAEVNKLERGIAKELKKLGEGDDQLRTILQGYIKQIGDIRQQYKGDQKSITETYGR